jgi:uncharacterized protein YeaO (DUF488 family)
MTQITTGRIHDKKDWIEKGWTTVDVTVKSAKGNAKSLAPTWNMVLEYKKGKMTKEQYTSLYKTIMKTSQNNNRQQWINTIKNHQKIVFLCYCKTEEFCHRHLLAQEFINFAQQINIKANLIPERENYNTTMTQQRKTFKTITKLKQDQVFVFGSNLNGFHGAGAAGFAQRGTPKNNWRQDQTFLKALRSPPDSLLRQGMWSYLGQGRGYQEGSEGASYAIATVTKPRARRSIPLQEILVQLKELGSFARSHPEKTFFCAISGGGYNGYSRQEIENIYDQWIKEDYPPLNIHFPSK